MRRSFLPGLLLILLLILARVSWQQQQRFGEVHASCEQATQGSWQEALTQGPWDRGDAVSLDGTLCRCQAWAALDQLERCQEELSTWSQEGDLQLLPQDWAQVLLQSQMERQEHLDALELAQTQRAADPGSMYWTQALMEVLRQLPQAEEERRLLEEERWRAGPGAGPLSLQLSRWARSQGDYSESLRLLGSDPPEDPALSHGWYADRLHDLGRLDRPEEARLHAARWEAAGESAARVRAYYALSVAQGLSDPQSPLDWLEAALSAEEALPADLAEFLHNRRISFLVTHGRIEEALEAYDQARSRHELARISRESILRSDPELGARLLPPMRFKLPASAERGTLWLPPQDGSVLEAWLPHPLLPGEELSWRPPDSSLVLWALTDEQGLRARGASWPGLEDSLSVLIQPTAARPLARYEPSERRAGDGQRRIRMILLDCADWSLLNWTRAQGQAPFMDWMAREGLSAVLWSDPPFTAAAMNSLVFPGRRRQRSTLGLLHELGVELGGLAAIGQNPMEALSWLLPESQDLFQTLGSGQLSAANLLFSHGPVEAGRHAMATGPYGAEREISLFESPRSLSGAEEAHFDTLLSERRDRELLEVIASQLDAAASAAPAEQDLWALRVEALDLLTHGHYSSLPESGQAPHMLPEVYAYIDRRLGEVYDSMDADDQLLILSDHGIASAMEHRPEALFLTHHGERGGGVSLKELAPFTAVPRYLAGRLGVTTGWPGPDILFTTEGDPHSAPQ